MLAQRDNEFKLALNNSWMTVPDGMPVAWGARLLGGKIKKNVRGTELMFLSCKLATKMNYSIFLYGSKPETLQNLKDSIHTTFPTLKISGKYSPPFRPLSLKEEIKIIDIINAVSPDILFIGLGAPKQEKWMFKHSPKINASVIMGVGAAFDFLAGGKKQAPLWIQSIGLEWLFRLFSEPRRLWKRYIIYNTLYIFLFTKQLLKKKIG
jgi:N-acetylglucosaminyldiphosphoundecaprenol N-acetyl-beta-D-mannosaminyltransferase